MSALHRTIAIAAGLVAALASAPASAQAQSELLRLESPSPIRAWEGTSVFSAFDRASERYFLTVRRSDGTLERLDVAPQLQPFEADIGPDSNGEPELVYSRCSERRPGDFPEARGCDLFVYSLARAGGERPVDNANTGHSETAPTLWRGRIAFARRYEDDANAIAYTKRLTAPRERPSRRLAGVPTRRCPEYSGPEGCEEATSRGSVEAQELYGRRLAQVVSYQVGDRAGVGPGRFNEVRLVDLQGGVRRIAAQIAGESGRAWVGPSFANGRLGFYGSCLSEPTSCARDAGAYLYRISTGRLGLAESATPYAGYARTGDGEALAVAGEPACDGSFQARSCPVSRLDPGTYERVDPPTP